MRSKLYNLVIELIPALFFSIAVFVLFKPWLSFLLESMGFVEAYDLLPVWSISVLTFFIFLAKWLSKLQNSKRYIFLASYVGLNSLVLLLIKWPLSVFLPFSLFLILFGLRFRLYYTIADVRRDIGWGILVFFFTLAISTKIPLSIGFLDIIVFFIAIASVGVFFNLKSLKEEGFSPQYRLSFLIIISSSAVIFFSAFLLGMPLESGMIQAFLNVLRQIYLFFVNNIVMSIIYALIWILRPLFNLIENINISPPERVREEQNPIGSMEDLTEGISGSEAGGGPIVQYILWGLLFLILASVLVLLIRRLSGDREGGSSEEGVTEESESIFSISELANRAKRGFSSFNKVFSKYLNNPRNRYKGEDPITRIRWIYFCCAQKLSKFVSFKVSNTPKGYLKRIYQRFEKKEAGPELAELTEIYNKARYGERVLEEDAERAQKLWQKIKKRLKEKE